jgi:hypothetical protein
VAAYGNKETPCVLIAIQDNQRAAEMAHSPLSVVAWHGNFAPYIDLSRFMVIGTISFDHRSLDLQRRRRRTFRHRQYRLRHLPAALAGRRDRPGTTAA